MTGEHDEPLVAAPDFTDVERRAARAWIACQRLRQHVPRGVVDTVLRVAPKVLAFAADRRRASTAAFPHMNLSLPATDWVAVFEEGESARSREEEAARLIYALLMVRQRIFADDWQDQIRGEPVEVATYRNFFGTSMVPAGAGAFAVAQADSKHIVVLVGGRAFRVDLVRGGKLIGLGELTLAVRACVQSNEANVAPGIATSLPFSDYSKFYAASCLDPDNLRSFRVCSHALFVVCLDDEQPASLYDIGHLAQAGSRENRWFVNALQLVVFKNRRSALVGNLSLRLEGTQAARFAGLVAECLKELPSEWDDGSTGARAVSPLLWNLDAASLERARQFSERVVTWRPDGVFDIEFGTALPRKLGVGAAAAFHLVMLASAADLLGAFPTASTQLVSMRHMATADSLANQSLVSSEAREFYRLLRRGADREDIRTALKAADRYYKNSLSAIQEGLDSLAVASSGSYDSLRWKQVMGGLARAEQGTNVFSWSLIKRSEGVAAIGRFGVVWPYPTTAGHAYIESEKTRIIVVQGKDANVDLVSLKQAANRTIEQLRQLV